MGDRVRKLGPNNRGPAPQTEKFKLRVHVGLHVGKALTEEVFVEVQSAMVDRRGSGPVRRLL